MKFTFNFNVDWKFIAALFLGAGFGTGTIILCAKTKSDDAPKVLSQWGDTTKEHLIDESLNQ